MMKSGGTSNQPLLVGVTVAADSSIKFAQISIASGSAGSPRWEPSGRLFRFGVDTAAYFAPPHPGTYTVAVRALGRGESGCLVSEVIQVAPRPLCQDFAFNLHDASVPANGPSLECMPVRIL